MGRDYYWSHGCSSLVLEQVLSVLKTSPWLRPYLSISTKWKHSPMSHIDLFCSQRNLLELQARNAEMCSVSNEALWKTARGMTAQHLWNLWSQTQTRVVPRYSSPEVTMGVPAERNKAKSMLRILRPWSSHCGFPMALWLKQCHLHHINPPVITINGWW